MTAVPPNLGALYLRYRDAMYKVAASVLWEVGRASEAGDAVNDAIVSIMTAPPKHVRNWETFLVTAAKRKALDRVRSADVRHTGPEFVESVHDRADGTDIAEDVATDLDRKERATVARDCLGILDERHRKIVWKIVALEQSRGEVAAELAVSPARVSQMTTRALVLLREEMNRREGGREGTMNDEDRDRLLAELIEKPQERERILRDAEFTDRDRDEIATLLDTADKLWLSAHGAPTLDDDPVAAVLGLVPDPECRLDSAALSRTRKRAGLTVSDVAQRLRERGWEFEKGDVFRWETRTAVDVPPAVVQAIADILSTPVDGLIAASSSLSAPDHLAAVRRHPLFEQLVDRWARVQRVSPAVALATLDSRMLATVHRGEQPDAEQLLRSLDALVTSVERADQE